jgi:Domain of unknown function (DUF4375)
MERQRDKLPWLETYGGQTTDELLSLEGKYRIDSLITAFEQALDQKAARIGEAALTDEERLILTVEALEREVNNGGYAQFFKNSSREYAAVIVGSLRRIDCLKTAALTQRAIAALGTSELTPDGIEGTLAREDPQRQTALNLCDEEYYSDPEPIGLQLFAFIKANKDRISLQ